MIPYQYPNGALARSFKSIFSGKSIQWKKREQRIHEVRLSASAGLPGDFDDVGESNDVDYFLSPLLLLINGVVISAKDASILLDSIEVK